VWDRRGTSSAETDATHESENAQALAPECHELSRRLLRFRSCSSSYQSAVDDYHFPSFLAVPYLVRYSCFDLLCRGVDSLIGGKILAFRVNPWGENVGSFPPQERVVTSPMEEPGHRLGLNWTRNEARVHDGMWPSWFQRIRFCNEPLFFPS